MSRRWWYVLLVPAYTACMAWLATAIFIMSWAGLSDFHLFFSPSEWTRALADDEWWWVIGLPVVLLVATQICFLLPIGSFKAQPARSGTSLKITVIMAAIVAAALTVGLIGAFWNLVHLFQFILGYRSPLSFDIDLGDEHRISFIAVVAASWIFWSAALLVFASRNPDRWIGGRLLGLLLGGTVTEAIIVLPLDIMVRRNSECYCSTGTFITLCMSAWALLWLAGPGAVIALTSKRRRLWWETHCRNCGYPMGPSPGDRCPECGFDWRASSATPQAADKRQTPDF